MKNILIYILEIYRMSENIIYNKTKVDNFISAYQIFKDSMGNFITKTQNFNNVLSGYDYIGNEIQAFTGEIKKKEYLLRSSDGISYYVFEPSNIIKKYEGKNDHVNDYIELDEETSLILDSEDNYNKIVNIRGTIGDEKKVLSGIYISDVVTIDRFLSAKTNIKAMRHLNSNVQPNYDGMGRLINSTLDIKKNGLDNGVKNITPAGDKVNIQSVPSSCNSDFFQKCLTNTVVEQKGNTNIMFALRNDPNTNNCECYDLTNKGDLGENIDFYEKILVPPSPLNPNENINFFGLFMNGTVRGLKDPVYRKNFKNYFEFDNNKFINIPNLGKLSNLPKQEAKKLHPFVGHGMHSFNINAFENRS